MSEVGQGNARSTLLFLEADEGTLVRRFSETRRSHPLAGGGHVLEGIRKERELLAEIRGAADMVLDTSNWTIHDTRSRIFREFADTAEEQIRPIVSLVSFGFKHGVPGGTDLLFDVRFLANPYFEDGLRELSGKNTKLRRSSSGIEATVSRTENTRCSCRALSLSLKRRPCSATAL